MSTTLPKLSNNRTSKASSNGGDPFSQGQHNIAKPNLSGSFLGMHWYFLKSGAQSVDTAGNPLPKTMTMSKYQLSKQRREAINSAYDSVIDVDEELGNILQPEIEDEVLRVLYGDRAAEKKKEIQMKITPRRLPDMLDPSMFSPTGKKNQHVFTSNDGEQSPGGASNEPALNYTLHRERASPKKERKVEAEAEAEIEDSPEPHMVDKIAPKRYLELEEEEATISRELLLRSSIASVREVNDIPAELMDLLMHANLNQNQNKGNGAKRPEPSESNTPTTNPSNKALHFGRQPSRDKTINEKEKRDMLREMMRNRHANLVQGSIGMDKEAMPQSRFVRATDKGAKKKKYGAWYVPVKHWRVVDPELHPNASVLPPQANGKRLLDVNEADARGSRIPNSDSMESMSMHDDSQHKVQISSLFSSQIYRKWLEERYGGQDEIPHYLLHEKD